MGDKSCWTVDINYAASDADLTWQNKDSYFLDAQTALGSKSPDLSVDKYSKINSDWEALNGNWSIQAPRVDGDGIYTVRAFRHLPLNEDWYMKGDHRFTYDEEIRIWLFNNKKAV